MNKIDTVLEINQKMDLRSRTVPGRSTINPEPSEGSCV